MAAATRRPLRDAHAERGHAARGGDHRVDRRRPGARHAAADLAPEGGQPEQVGRERDGPAADRRSARAGASRSQADQYAYTAGSSSLSIRFPSWALEGGGGPTKARLNDPATWAKIKKEMAGARRRARLHRSVMGDRGQLSRRSVAERPDDEGGRAEARRGDDRGRAVRGGAAAHARRRRVDGLPLHERRRHRAHHAASDGRRRVGCRSRPARAPACRTRAGMATPCACSASTCASGRRSPWKRPCGR